MADENKRETRESKIKGPQTLGRGGGQPKPKTPSGERKPWTPPKNDTTPQTEPTTSKNEEHG